MRRQFLRLTASRTATAAAFCAALFFVGCEKKPTAKAPESESRMKDPAYRAQLKELGDEQARLASRAARVEAQLDKLRARAKANLGGTATDEQIEAELKAHPEKYVGLKELQARAEANDTARKEALEKARATVRERILKEQADRKAVSQQK